MVAATFDVREDGALDFEPQYDAFLGGRQLTARCVPVASTPGNLDHPLTPDLPDAAVLAADRTHS
ncbi:hypothetical protein ACFTWS_33435 [Streptomyces sp. NPDC057027]|uniref:hypothetical protein n=1 Tax=Streptomyces sp. NPDC057027 TaxID=3346004 RepID=UPI0036434257